MQRLSISPASGLPQPTALSLLEVLVTLTLLATLTALTGGALTTLASWRGLSAVQQLAADLDEARALALTEQQEIWLAFAPVGAEAYRAYVRCAARRGPEGERVLHPVGDWRRLPPGLVFSLAAPASPEAGRNLLTDTAALQSVLLAGSERQLPCLGFGGLGQILHPPLGRPLLAMTEGEVEHGLPRQRHGSGPDSCRWLVLHRHTGNALLLP